MHCARNAASAATPQPQASSASNHACKGAEEGLIICPASDQSNTISHIWALNFYYAAATATAGFGAASLRTSALHRLLQFLSEHVLAPGPGRLLIESPCRRLSGLRDQMALVPSQVPPMWPVNNLDNPTTATTGSSISDYKRIPAQPCN